jgi:hypothetical protein
MATLCCPAPRPRSFLLLTTRSLSKIEHRRFWCLGWRRSRRTGNPLGGLHRRAWSQLRDNPGIWCRRGLAGLLEIDRHGLHAGEALVGAIFGKPGRLEPRPDDRHRLLAARAAGHLRRIFVRHRAGNALRLVLVALSRNRCRSSSAPVREGDPGFTPSCGPTDLILAAPTAPEVVSRPGSRAGR